MFRRSGKREGKLPCARCTILRAFLGLVLMLVILGITAGNKLDYFALITTQKVANMIWVIGIMIFISKLGFWFWDRKNSNNYLN